MSKGAVSTTYCISDIHGCFRRFTVLLEKIQFSDSDTLFVLGDAIDRGEDSVPCLQYIMARPNIKMLMGNHEQMMLDAMESERDRDLWVDFNGGAKTYAALSALPSKEVDDILRYVRALPYIYSVQVQQRDFLLVHAGLDLTESDDNEDLSAVIARQSPNELLWSRDEFYTQKGLPGRTIIFGHTPTAFLYQNRHNNTIWHDPVWKDKIGIDCWSFRSRQLGALRLDDMQEFYCALFE